ncbi:uncharacterized protein METZ01_LOCUS342775 [marine metagenome]|uniref:Uncharacterized protein n=1 Tax=marine metagenome TaxID=408172 RepID=A0A382QZZ7_9ZZZZ
MAEIGTQTLDPIGRESKLNLRLNRRKKD